MRRGIKEHIFKTALIVSDQSVQSLFFPLIKQLVTLNHTLPLRLIVHGEDM